MAEGTSSPDVLAGGRKGRKKECLEEVKAPTVDLEKRLQFMNGRGPGETE